MKKLILAILFTLASAGIITSVVIAQPKTVLVEEVKTQAVETKEVPKTDSKPLSEPQELEVVKESPVVVDTPQSVLDEPIEPTYTLEDITLSDIKFKSLTAECVKPDIESRFVHASEFVNAYRQALINGENIMIYDQFNTRGCVHANSLADLSR